MIIRNQTFIGRGAFTQPFDFADGIFGLGDARSTDEFGLSPILNMVQQGLLEEPKLALYLHAENGFVNFGATDASHYRDPMIFLPVSGTSMWAAALTALTVGQETTDNIAFDAIFDSGTSVIALPSSLADMFHRAIGARRGPPHQRHVIECDTQDALPDLIISLVGSNFTLSSTDYIRRADDKCTSLIAGIDFPPPLGPIALLGTPFLEKYYSVYDLAKDTVGLALAT
jgi:saccharopepsin